MRKKTPKQKQEAASATDATGIRLQQPDRSGPKGKTLLQFADDRSLFDRADERQRQLNRERGLPEDTGIIKKKAKPEDDSDSESDDEDDDGPAVSPRAERILDTLLWCISLATLHFTLDVLVQNQYAVSLEWPVVIWRALLALGVFVPLFYNLHRHPLDPRLLFLRSPPVIQDRVRQALFFATSTLAGCYLIHITNNYGYIAVMEQAPPLGCLWVWSVIEMDLAWAVSSLAIAGAFMKLKGYGI
ncbi:hypothetical protein F503_04863 [Ophiostoma piceae UAMH 11346]|uniref:DUF7719 domain-containing protein n=1 Tax=Ophiostoma piceae (strain UAMH 11346) TaxID=1262450 RepID=S3CTJ2_OPHP1|nr:hypothetical protein F503_04863 [Ophiostoma piceae UAMH 11346]